MTGLDPQKHVIVEIAALVTDAELNILGDGVDVVVHASEIDLAQMDDVVTEMHNSSGLTEEIRESAVDVHEAERIVLDYIREWVPNARQAPLAGNSIASDRGFIRRYMPELEDFLHYRMIDVSSLKELARRWYPRVYFGQPEKGMSHRALADIRESIRELEFYRRAMMVPGEGPTKEEVARAAEDAVRAVPMD
ncbi:oligoribonuclease [Corynebacterium xerosis]|uniref:Oligoribonuclease n=2 Tax=Corynebacterium xerosis TaxID=1725 RepID=A0A7X9SYG5_9CORY|nr:oligoribonuclease [Corynebacterium xerosis]